MEPVSRFEKVVVPFVYQAATTVAGLTAVAHFVRIAFREPHATPTLRKQLHTFFCSDFAAKLGSFIFGDSVV